MARPPKEPNPNPSTLSEAVGAGIRQRRLKKGLTAEQAAAAAGVPAPTWYHFEAGKLTIDRLPAIAEALGCSLRSLLPAEWPS